MTTAATAHDLTAELWREARAWLADAMRDLRAPAAVSHVIAGKIRPAIKRQIARLELLLTKLPSRAHPRAAAANPAHVNATGHALYAAQNLPGDDTS